MSAPVQAADVIAALTERRLAHYTSSPKRQPYARTNSIASDLGDCDRALALGVLAWKVRPPFPPEALARMENGEDHELRVVLQLAREGWQVVEQQVPIEIKDRSGRVVLLRGKIDGKLVWPLPDGRRALVPIEIKETSDANWRRWHTEDDLRVDRWARKWWRQIQVYMLSMGFEWALLLLTHRSERRAIEIRLDYQAAEVILQRLERAHAVREALAGDPLDSLDSSLSELGVAYLGDRTACASCDFRGRVCLPPQPGSAGELELALLDDEVGRLVERERALAPAAREHDSLKRQLEKQVPRGTHARAGDWIVTGHWQTQKTSPVPAQPAQPPKPAGTQQVWKRAFVRVSDLAAPPSGVGESEEGGSDAAHESV